MRDWLTLTSHVLVAGLLALGGIALQPGHGHAQATAITSSGLGTVLTNQSGTVVQQCTASCNIAGGSRAGSNLFHSFGLFSVGVTKGVNDIAKFINTTPPTATTNVLGRVTGGQVSDIFGTIDTQTSFPGANLFLLNPVGVVFRPSAKLNVSGSVHVGTGNYIGFTDGSRFLADASQTSVPPLGANPVSFGFLTANPGRITVNGSAAVPAQALQVNAGKTLSLVGGDVQIIGAPGGATPNLGPATGASGITIQIASVNSTGEAIVVKPTGQPGLDVNTFSQLGSVTLSNNARIDASPGRVIPQSPILVQGPGGTVVIRGGTLNATGTTILATTTGNTNGAALGVDIQVAGNMTLSGSSIQVGAQRNGNGGAIQVVAGSLQMQNGSVMGTTTSGGTKESSTTGVGGDISLNVGSLTLTGTSTGTSRINTTTQQGVGPGGPGGNVLITATGPVTISGLNAGFTSTTVATAASGVGGAITISAPSLTLDAGSTILTRSTGTSAITARGGDVVINVNDLSMTGGAQITSRVTKSAGGKVFVTATDSAMLSGTTTGIFSGGAAGGSTTAVVGDISMNVGHLTLADAAQIQNGSVIGRTGNLAITATDGITISTGAGISSQAFAQDVGQVSISAPSLFIDNGFISTSTISSGRAGKAAISVGTLTLQDGGQILSSSENGAPGAGGDLSVTATNSVAISGSSPSGSRQLLFTTDPSSGLFSRATGSGDAGQITVAAPSMTLTNGGKMSVATSGSGRAGDIAVTTANGPLSLASGARVDSSTTASGHGGNITIGAAGGQVVIDGSSGLFSTASGIGDAGQISVSAPSVRLTNGGQISVATSAAGRGGDISVNAANGTVSLASNARIDSGTTGAGHGGNMTIDATGGQITMSGAASLSSNAGGSGPGGDLNVRAQQVQLTDGAAISAKSSGTANALAGNVSIRFGDTFTINGGTITTQSAVADGGNISITSTGSLFHLVDGQITTSVQSGSGGGGNIAIGSAEHPIGMLVLDGSQIRADAFGGPGGNINIAAGVYLAQGSVVSASSALSAPGTIDVQARVTDVSGSVGRLPETVLQAALLLRASCTARLAAGKSSSLVLAGREGVPPEPDSLLWSPLLADDPVAMAPSTIEDLHAELLPRFLRASLDPKCVR